jgi:DNA-binding NarL/FixJ family response regulator
MANQEIADDMNISVKTVEAQITKALKIIKKSLGEGYAYLF